jgi:hypothetical protein
MKERIKLQDFFLQLKILFFGARLLCSPGWKLRILLPLAPQCWN